MKKERRVSRRRASPAGLFVSKTWIEDYYFNSTTVAIGSRTSAGTVT